MKTAIYIDGYNLYYSRLQGTAHKWLDVAALFREILRVQDPAATVKAIKYFTAPIKANYARHGQASEEAQTQYLRALAAREPGLIEIIQGFHIFKPTSLPTHETGLPPSKARRQSVWMIEEKLTDVQLALTIYRDAARGDVDQVVVCSNDSDVEPALQLVRRDAPHVRIGLVMPLAPHAKGQGIVSNKRLTAQAHWVRHHILDVELAASQLPPHVSTKKKPASKPAHW
ncbi:MAG: NYN domain-containing protein [Proteobacteria bacterium]|nr:NYN domain-containing protein [Pseudomonadota bacterium]MDN4592232.1 NYN domain-containing protein [Xenophilus aerolatus]